MFEPFPGQRLTQKQIQRRRDEELAQFAAAAGTAPPPATPAE